MVVDKYFKHFAGLGPSRNLVLRNEDFTAIGYGAACGDLDDGCVRGASGSSS